MIGDKREVILWLSNQKDGIYKAEPHRSKRSLSANAYYWQAAGMIAEALEVSTAYVHNMLMRECAPPIDVDGRLMYVFLPDTPEAESDVMESATYHLKPTSQIRPGKKGQPNFRAYVLLKGSSDFDTKEMSNLINKAVSTCRDLDLTPPPTALIKTALRRMKRQEERGKG